MLNLLRRPTITAKDLDEGLAELGLDGTQHVIVHASLKSFGHLDGGAQTMVDVLTQRTRTLVAPAFTYNTLLSQSTAAVHSTFFRFSRVSKDIGRVPQEMVERMAAIRSFHPALSFIAMGEKADFVTASQSLEIPYLPIGALYNLRGYALLIGVDFDSNTSIHYGEYLAGVPLLTRYVPLDNQVVKTAFPNCSAQFENLQMYMTGYMRSIRIGNAQLRLYRVRDLVKTTIHMLERNPEGLLCDSRHCRCQEVREDIRRYGLQPRLTSLD